MHGAGAFLVSFLAGSATVLGGLGSIWASSTLSARGFAVTLAFAAGVMCFVSFVEIYAQGTEYLEHSFERRITKTDNKENLVKGAALSVGMGLFFCGWILANLMDCLVHLCMDSHAKRAQRREEESLSIAIGQSYTEDAPSSSSRLMTVEKNVGGIIIEEDSSLQEPVTCLGRFWQNPLWKNFVGIDEVDDETQEHVKRIYAEDCAKMTRLGYFTALVLTLHNFPEGIATFTSSAADSKVGIGLGIAIGIHNIPEGIAVAVPILIGTGSRWKAFVYATVSGMAEPLGGLITWLAIGDHQGNMMMGVIFMIIAGIMVNVSVKELLFAAIKYDPGNVVVSFAFTLGMVIMAISLCGLYLA